MSDDHDHDHGDNRWSEQQLRVKALESLLVRARQGLSQQLARQGLLEGAQR